jgi:hypothetical protein
MRDESGHRVEVELVEKNEATIGLRKADGESAVVERQ